MTIPTTASPEWLIGVVIVLLWSVRTDIYKAYGFITGKVKEKDDKVEKRFVKIETCVEELVDKASFEKRLEHIEERDKLKAAELLNMHNIQQESMRMRETLKADIFHRLDNHEKDLRTLENVPGRLKTLEDKYVTIDKKLDEVKTTMANMPQTIKQDMRDIMDLLIKANLPK